MTYPPFLSQKLGKTKNMTLGFFFPLKGKLEMKGLDYCGENYTLTGVVIICTDQSLNQSIINRNLYYWVMKGMCNHYTTRRF